MTPKNDPFSTTCALLPSQSPHRLRISLTASALFRKSVKPAALPKKEMRPFPSSYSSDCSSRLMPLSIGWILCSTAANKTRSTSSSSSRASSLRVLWPHAILTRGANASPVVPITSVSLKVFKGAKLLTSLLIPSLNQLLHFSNGLTIGGDISLSRKQDSCPLINGVTDKEKSLLVIPYGQLVRSVAGRVVKLQPQILTLTVYQALAIVGPSCDLVVWCLHTDEATKR